MLSRFFAEHLKVWRWSYAYAGQKLQYKSKPGWTNSVKKLSRVSSVTTQKMYSVLSRNSMKDLSQAVEHTRWDWESTAVIKNRLFSDTSNGASTRRSRNSESNCDANKGHATWLDIVSWHWQCQSAVLVIILTFFLLANNVDPCVCRHCQLTLMANKLCVYIHYHGIDTWCNNKYSCNFLLFAYVGCWSFLVVSNVGHQNGNWHCWPIVSPNSVAYAGQQYLSMWFGAHKDTMILIYKVLGSH